MATKNASAATTPRIENPVPPALRISGLHRPSIGATNAAFWAWQAGVLYLKTPSVVNDQVRSSCCIRRRLRDGVAIFLRRLLPWLRDVSPQPGCISCGLREVDGGERGSPERAVVPHDRPDEGCGSYAEALDPPPDRARPEFFHLTLHLPAAAKTRFRIVPRVVAISTVASWQRYRRNCNGRSRADPHDFARFSRSARGAGCRPGSCSSVASG